MGCDIHCSVEVKKDGVWVSHTPLVDNPWYNDDRPEDKWNTKQVEEGGYDGRNYSLFAILADVRNGSGFAGVKTGDGFIPISDPKDLPEDAGAVIRQKSDDYGGDGHSHSWLTLTEMLDYDWEQVTQQQGIIDFDYYKEWDKKSEPESYCGGVFGPGIVVMSEDEYLADPSAKPTNILVKWVITYRDAAGEMWWKVIDRLKKYADEFGGTDNVRLVFFFDN